MVPEHGTCNSSQRKEVDMANESYEFSPEQNRILHVLARLMKYTAVAFLFLGVIIGTLCGFTVVNNNFRGSM